MTTRKPLVLFLPFFGISAQIVLSIYMEDALLEEQPSTLQGRAVRLRKAAARRIGGVHCVAEPSRGAPGQAGHSCGSGLGKLGGRRLLMRDDPPQWTASEEADWTRLFFLGGLLGERPLLARW